MKLVHFSELTNACRDTGSSSLSLLDAIENNSSAVPSEVEATVRHVQHMLQLAEALVPKSDDVKATEIGDLVESEMQSTTAAIDAAANKIQVRRFLYFCFA